MKRNKTNKRDFKAQALPQLESLYCTALYMLDIEFEANNLVQESFIWAYNSRQVCQFRPNSRIWLFKIMSRILIYKFRSSFRLSSVIKSAEMIDGYLIYSRWADQQPLDESYRVPFSAVSEDDIRKSIRNMPFDFKLVVVLSLVQGFSYQEIADIVGIDLEAVRFRLRHGRTLMQRNLFDHITPGLGVDIANRATNDAAVERYFDRINESKETNMDNNTVSKFISHSRSNA